MNQNLITVKTSSPCGDLLAAMPSFRQLFKQSGKRILVYQALNVVGEGYPGVKQAFTNENGESIMMSKKTFNMVRPLLRTQEYIEDLIEFEGQDFMYDLDDIRLKTFCNQSVGSLNRVLWYAFPEMACDLSEVSLVVDKTETNTDYFDKVIINFTPRFRNHWINYYFLKDYQDKLLFAGLEKERLDFCNKWLLDIPLLETSDFYELAVAMNSCKFFMSNQTAFFQIAENLKIPRLLETCPTLAHVIPFGANGYDAYHQLQMEFYFKKLIK